MRLWVIESEWKERKVKFFEDGIWRSLDEAVDAFKWLQFQDYNMEKNMRIIELEERS